MLSKIDNVVMIENSLWRKGLTTLKFKSHLAFQDIKNKEELKVETISFINKQSF